MTFEVEDIVDLKDQFQKKCNEVDILKLQISAKRKEFHTFCESNDDTHNFSRSEESDGDILRFFEACLDVHHFRNANGN